MRVHGRTGARLRLLSRRETADAVLDCLDRRVAQVLALRDPPARWIGPVAEVRQRYGAGLAEDPAVAVGSSERDAHAQQ